MLYPPMSLDEAKDARARRDLAALVSKVMGANGAKGGRAAAAKLTPEQRRDRAKKAAAARHRRRA